MNRPFLAAACAAFALTACSGGSGGTPSLPPVPAGPPPAGLSFSWAASYAPGQQSGGIGFPLWFGTWPDVALATADVTLIGSTPGPYALAPTAQCATVARESDRVFRVTQGNNGMCVLVGSDGNGGFVPIPVDAGYPAHSALRLQRDAQPMTTTAIVLDVATQAAHISAYDVLEPLGTMTSGNRFTATVYGDCAAVTPAFSTAVPATFALVRIAAHPCFAIFSDAGYESRTVWLQ